MRRLPVLLLVTSLLSAIPAPGVAAELVETKLVWDQASRIDATDLTRFDNRWLMVCAETQKQAIWGGVFRVRASKDGSSWTTVAILKSPTPNRGLYQPKFSHAPDGRLLLTGYGVVPFPDSPEPIPTYGGTLQAMAWSTTNGHDWSEPVPVGQFDYPLGRVTWRDGVAYSYCYGRICGSIATIQIHSGPSEQRLGRRYEHTFSGFYPGEAAFAFDSDNVAYCFMSRGPLPLGDRPWPTAYVGTAKPPYANWTWRELDRGIDVPNAIRLPNGRILVSAGLKDDRTRTSLCEFDPKTGSLTELLELPTSDQAVETGLVYHQGDLWVSYHAENEGPAAAYLARVKIR